MVESGIFHKVSGLFFGDSKISNLFSHDQLKMLGWKCLFPALKNIFTASILMKIHGYLCVYFGKKPPFEGLHK